MTDQQISQFITSQRPDYINYYNSTISPGGSAGADDPGLLAWAHNQFAASPEDTAQFTSWANSQAGGSVPPTFSGGDATGATTGAGGAGFTQAPNPNVTGGNYNQVQNATQGGQFITGGVNDSTQNQTSGQNQTGTNSTTGSNVTTGSNNQNTSSTGTQDSTSNTTGTTTSNTTGSQTNNAIDTYGFGQLLKDQAGSTGASDAARSSWLQDVMQNGGTGFNSQVDQAVRNSLSGPRMTGAGDSAQARASGYAAADIGRNNLNQRLAASEQLAGPTGLQNLSKAADPYIGSQSNSTGTNTSFQDLLTKGTQNTTGNQNTSGTQNSTSLTDQLQNTASNSTGFQNLVAHGSESQAGTTAGQSSQSGAGQIPQGQPVKTGGCVLCTAAIELGLSKHHKVLRRVIKHKLLTDSSRFASAAKGYFAVFTPLASWLLAHPRVARVLWPLAKAVVYEELRVSGRKLPLKPWAWLVHWTGHAFCAGVGATFPVKGFVHDEKILSIARRENILFEVQA